MSMTDDIKMPSGLSREKSSDQATDGSNNTYGDLRRPSLMVGDVNELSTQPQRRHFSAFNIVALGFNICNSWVAIASSLALTISAGGSPTLIYGVILAAVAYAAVGASLSEMASVWPTAGGQYHFTSILAPKKYSRGISYSCGAIAIFSWIALGASATIFIAQEILSLAAFYNPSYVAQAWHYFMVYQAANIVFLLYNLFAMVKTPWVHNLGLILTLTAFAVITVTCLARSEKQSTEYVWETLSNSTGWPDGVTFLTGFVTPCFMFVGLDASLHLAEECTEPKKTVPKAVMTTVVIGSVTGFVFSIAMCYGITDLEALLSVTMPIYELWRQATGSDAAATAFFVMLLVVTLFVVNAVQQTSSHLIWAFGRDNGVFFSGHLSTMHKGLGVPVWALLANAFVVFICGCIYLASPTAFSALVNSSVVLQVVSFAIPCALLMLRGRSKEFLPENRWFKMPAWLGWTSNALVVIFAIVELIFFDFPSAIPTTGSTMNYTVAVLAIMALFTAINWFAYARKGFKGPRIDLYSE